MCVCVCLIHRRPGRCQDKHRVRRIDTRGYGAGLVFHLTVQVAGGVLLALHVVLVFADHLHCLALAHSAQPVPGNSFHGGRRNLVNLFSHFFAFTLKKLVCLLVH